MRANQSLQRTGRASRSSRFKKWSSACPAAERRSVMPLRVPLTEIPMTDKYTWFVTGAGRGMGVDIVKAALAAGHRVVATGRNPDAVAKAIDAGKSDDLLPLKLDVTKPDEGRAAVAAATARFGRID